MLQKSRKERKQEMLVQSIQNTQRVNSNNKTQVRGNQAKQAAFGSAAILYETATDMGVTFADPFAKLVITADDKLDLLQLGNGITEDCFNSIKSLGSFPKVKELTSMLKQKGGKILSELSGVKKLWTEILADESVTAKLTSPQGGSLRSDPITYADKKGLELLKEIVEKGRYEYEPNKNTLSVTLNSTEEVVDELGETTRYRLFKKGLPQPEAK